MSIFAPNPLNATLPSEVRDAHNRIDYCVDYRRSGTSSATRKDGPNSLHSDFGDNHNPRMPTFVIDVRTDSYADGVRFEPASFTIELTPPKLVAVTLKAEGVEELVHLAYEDGSAVDLRGPRSGMKFKERSEGSTQVVD